MTEQDVKQSMNLAVQTFNNKVYQGFMPLDLIEKFKVAIMKMPPSNHAYRSDLIRSIVSKHQSDLTMLEVGVIVNLLYTIPPEVFFITLEEWLDFHDQLVRLNVEYNKETADFNKGLAKRERKLRELAGLDNAIRMPSLKN